MTTRTKLLIGAAVIALVGAGAGGVWWFLKDDAPAEVSLDAAVESVAGADSGSGSVTGTVDGIDGSWVVDTETGEFDFESATGTFVGFRIQEELAAIGSTTAVGRTGDVTGSITIEGSALTAATFDVDLTTITTNQSRRDDRVQDALETADHPTGTFTLTEPVELGEGARRAASRWPSRRWATSRSTVSPGTSRSRSTRSSSMTRWSSPDRSTSASPTSTSTCPIARSWSRSRTTA